MGCFLGGINALDLCCHRIPRLREIIAPFRQELLSNFKGFWQALGSVARLAWWEEPEDIFHPPIRDEIIKLRDESASVEANPAIQTIFEEKFAELLAGIDLTKSSYFH
jgi:hypothetical protein